MFKFNLKKTKQLWLVWKSWQTKKKKKKKVNVYCAASRSWPLSSTPPSYWLMMPLCFMSLAEVWFWQPMDSLQGLYNLPEATLQSLWQFLWLLGCQVLEHAAANLSEILLQELKRAVNKWKPANLTELKQYCKEDWSKIPPQCWGGW